MELVGMGSQKKAWAVCCALGETSDRHQIGDLVWQHLTETTCPLGEITEKPNFKAAPSYAFAADVLVSYS
eukprot:6368984-Amphidinium_carterae.1